MGTTVRARRPAAHLLNAVGLMAHARHDMGQTPGDGIDLRLEATILELLAARAATSTICPSDAARAVGDETWRDLMEPARRAARRLVDAGEVEITQGGSVVDPSTAKGPIRIRKVR